MVDTAELQRLERHLRGLPGRRHAPGGLAGAPAGQRPQAGLRAGRRSAAPPGRRGAGAAGPAPYADGGAGRRGRGAAPGLRAAVHPLRGGDSQRGPLRDAAAALRRCGRVHARSPVGPAAVGGRHPARDAARPGQGARPGTARAPAARPRPDRDREHPRERPHHRGRRRANRWKASDAGLDARGGPPQPALRNAARACARRSPTTRTVPPTWPSS